MANLSLAMQEDKKNPDGNKISSGQGIVFTVFILIVVAYLGILGYGKFIEKKMAQLNDDYSQQYEGFINNPKSKEVLDFQNRLTIATNSLKEEKNISVDLAELEKMIISGVYINKYSYSEENRVIGLDLSASDYGLVAQQIQSLKGSAYFNLSQVGGVKLDSKSGKITFSITLTANEPIKESQQ